MLFVTHMIPSHIITMRTHITLSRIPLPRTLPSSGSPLSPTSLPRAHDRGVGWAGNSAPSEAGVRGLAGVLAPLKLPECPAGGGVAAAGAALAAGSTGRKCACCRCVRVLLKVHACTSGQHTASNAPAAGACKDLLLKCNAVA
eukprot:scaffold42469_cov18-Tisochrysis_lutea.AAC.1